MRNYFQPSYYIPRRSIHHRHLVIFFLFLTIILLIILISGCTSAAAAGPSLYLVEFKYDAYSQPKNQAQGIVNSSAYESFNSKANQTSLNIHIGYFGICSQNPDSKNNTDWTCGNNINRIAEKISSDEDPFNILYAAFQLKGGAISPWMLIIGTCLIFVTTVALLMSRSAQNFSLPLATTLNVLGFLFILIGMVWQQTSVGAMATAIATLSEDAIQTKTGVSTAGLGWSSTIFVALCAGGMGIILLTEKRIEHETGEHHGVIQTGGAPGMGAPAPAAPPVMVDRYPSHHSHHSHFGSRGRSLSRHSMIRDGIEPEVRMPSPAY